MRGSGPCEDPITFEADVTTGPGGEFLGAALTLSGSGPDVLGSGAVTASVLGGGALPIIGLSNGSFVILTGVLFESYSFRRIHIPAFVELQSDVSHITCVESCRETCRKHGISLDVCDCSHCYKE